MQENIGVVGAACYFNFGISVVGVMWDAISATVIQGAHARAIVKCFAGFGRIRVALFFLKLGVRPGSSNLGSVLQRIAPPKSEARWRAISAITWPPMDTPVNGARRPKASESKPYTNCEAGHTNTKTATDSCAV